PERRLWIGAGSPGGMDRPCNGTSDGIASGCCSRIPEEPAMSHRLAATLGLFLAASGPLSAAEPDLSAYLDRPILGDRWTVHEVVELTEAKVPGVPVFKDPAEWEKYAARLRADVLDRIVYRGEAAAWRDARTKVEWLE